MTTWHAAGHSVVVTGGASGIGLAAATRFVDDGLNVLIADRDEEGLQRAVDSLRSRATADSKVLSRACDVTELAEVEQLRDYAFAELGHVHCIMNNAGAVQMVGKPWENLDELRRTLDINLWGVINGCHAFIPRMLESGQPGAVINTGSKQGITKPPGNYAYNLSKAGVLAYTESIANALATMAQCQLTAHLLVPGFVYTGMIAKFLPAKPDFAWTADQTVEFMMPCLERGDFYIICPDGETTREIDEKRIRWNAEDLIENRPALSRWHPDHKEAFAAYMQQDDD